MDVLWLSRFTQLLPNCGPVLGWTFAFSSVVIPVPIRRTLIEGTFQMATKDYLADVKRYEPAADEKAVAAIIKHLGIALKSTDASLVSCSSKDELERVRDSWLKKKLALAEDDKALDKAISDICTRMKADHSKERVTFYYLLAHKFGKLGALVK